MNSTEGLLFFCHGRKLVDNTKPRVVQKQDENVRILILSTHSITFVSLKSMESSIDLNAEKMMSEHVSHWEVNNLSKPSTSSRGPA
jgi:hypothetical protein